jgi:hypothetical protein
VGDRLELAELCGEVHRQQLPLPLGGPRGHLRGGLETRERRRGGSWWSGV